jgi:hypothetical protein
MECTVERVGEDPAEGQKKLTGTPEMCVYLKLKSLVFAAYERLEQVKMRC